MNGARVAWVVAGYLVGSFPTTYVLSRARGARTVIAASHRRSSDADAHIVMETHLGAMWAAMAITVDVLKGLGFALAARFLGDLPPPWLATACVAVIVGYTFPPYARDMAGRGIATGSGVTLAVVPVAMVIGGVVILAGNLAKHTGPASTLGFAQVPVTTWLLGEPRAFVWMGVAIFVVILLRRLVGVSEAAQSSTWPRALYRRLLFDADRPPGAAAF
jgi:glycerol-3-phosphate acyltransferase PlsY